MRALLVSALGVSCAAAMAAPLVMTSPAGAAPAAAVAPERVSAPARASAPDSAPALGSTRSLRLSPLADGRGSTVGAREQGLQPREVKPFSLLGVIWDDPDAELQGEVRVRTRDARTGRWSEWRTVQVHQHDHGADPDGREAAARRGAARGGTAPLWVGASDAVEVRVTPGGGGADASGAPMLPSGMRLELVDPGAGPGNEGGEGAGNEGGDGTGNAGTGAGDPGDGPIEPEEPGGSRPGAPLTEAETQAAKVNEPLAEVGAARVPAKSLEELRAEEKKAGKKAAPYLAPQPEIVTRRGWGADESIREKDFLYTNTVKAAFVHHSATGNEYTCAEAPAMIRGIYRYHVKSEGWRDLGYNFLVDKCGKIYEGRAGGVAKPVMGAHTLGFNEDSTGVSLLGTYTDTEAPAEALKSLEKLLAWKLGTHGVDASASTELVSGGGNRFPKGQSVEMKTVSGHRDGFSTECPGAKVYARLGEIRTGAAGMQGN